jgi:hypothetical protein
MALAQLLIDAMGAYLAAGVLFAVIFIARGMGRVDPVAQHASWGFRLIVMPGVAALWPLLLARWVRA